jgi:hypothetical protein
MAAPRYFIGWDVGGWNCDRNAASRDALVILGQGRHLQGEPWRGNLRATLNACRGTEEFVQALFDLCAAEPPAEPFEAWLGIDTPLGFSEELARLITRLEPVAALGASDSNPYLFRATERFLFAHGLRPLSAVKDMIGSQATKGLHVLGRFAPYREGAGLWTSSPDARLRLTAFEAWPSACKGSASLQALRAPYPGLGHDDKDDALLCALLAWALAEQPGLLAHPSADIPPREGWIYVPRDALR